MPKSVFKCYFGCAGGGVLHKFPSWEYPNQEKFRKWKAVLDTATQERRNKYIFYSLRLCERHFENCFISQYSGRLTNNAVPTLNLVQTSQQLTNPTSKPPTPEEVLQPSISACPSDLKVIKSERKYLRGLRKTNTVVQVQDKENVSPSLDDSVQKSKNSPNIFSSVQTIQPLAILTSETPTSQVMPQPSVSGVSACPKDLKEAKGVRKRLHGLRKTNVVGFKQHKQGVSVETLMKLKEKIKNLRTKIKTVKGELKAAKKISTSKSFLSMISKFPETIKTFTKMQCQFKKKPRGRRFTVEEKIMALTIFKQGPKAYKLLQKLFILPSRRCLQKLLSAFSISPGINEKVMKNIHEAVKKMPAEKKIVNLLFDEVSLAPALIYNQKKEEITGFEDLGEKRTPTIADHALVLMIKGVKGKTKQPICFTFCKSATKKNDLKELIIKAIREVRKIELKVICTICDQSSTNVSVIKSLQDDTRVKYLREGKDFHSKSFEVDGERVYPLFDTLHLLKGVRNNLLTKNATFFQEGKLKRAKWLILGLHLALLLDIDEGDDEIRLVNKLTENHVKPEKIPKMKVKFAAQVFSQRVSAAMRFLAKRNILPAECEETADFLLIFDKLFDSFNGHSYQDQPKVYKNCIKHNSPYFKLWADLLPILESIKFESVEKKNGIEVIKQVTIPSIKNWIHNIKCFIEMWNDLRLNHGIKNLVARNFNQDPLENFFSSIRSNGVRNVNPNCDQFINAYKTLIVNNFNSPHSPGANCEKDQDNCLQSLKNMITDNNEISQPDFACELDSLLSTVSDIKNNESIVHAESKKYVTGYVIKKCKSKIFKACGEKYLKHLQE